MRNANKTRKGKTDWNKLSRLTEAQLKKAASQDKDAPLLTKRELAQFKPVSSPDSINLKETREGMHLTQEQFANYFGVSKRTIQEWEQGRRRPTSTARNFLKVLIKAPKIVRKALEG